MSQIKNKQSHTIKVAEKLVANFFFADGILAIFTENLIRNYQLKFE